MQPFGRKVANEPMKMTIITETPRERITTVYDEIWPETADMRMEDPPRVVRDGSYVMHGPPTHADLDLRFAVRMDGEGKWGTQTRESLDPVPASIEKLVTEATKHNLNPTQQAKLIRSLNALVREDRKHNNKENNK